MEDKVDSEKQTEFERSESEKGLIAEFWEFLLDNKKYWLIPILIVFVLLAALVLLGGGSAAPFIYTLF